MTDNVNKPKHYEVGDLGIEVKDYIEAILNNSVNLNPYGIYCLGNVIKYISRAEHKNGTEDYKKAQVYLGWLIEQGVKGSPCNTMPSGDKLPKMILNPSILTGDVCNAIRRL